MSKNKQNSPIKEFNIKSLNIKIASCLDSMTKKTSYGTMMVNFTLVDGILVW